MISKNYLKHSQMEKLKTFKFKIIFITTLTFKIYTEIFQSVIDNFDTVHKHLFHRTDRRYNTEWSLFTWPLGFISALSHLVKKFSICVHVTANSLTPDCMTPEHFPRPHLVQLKICTGRIFIFLGICYINLMQSD